MDELRLLKLSDVIYICGISKSTIQRKVNKNEFPKSLIENEIKDLETISALTFEHVFFNS